MKNIFSNIIIVLALVSATGAIVINKNGGFGCCDDASVKSCTQLSGQTCNDGCGSSCDKDCDGTCDKESGKACDKESKECGTCTTCPTDAEADMSDQIKTDTTTTKLPILLDLGADKCIPCKAMMPVLDELKTQYAGKLEVKFIDVWKNPDAGTEYGVTTIPTQIFLDANGKELFRHIGFYAKEDILAKWQELQVELK